MAAAKRKRAGTCGSNEESKKKQKMRISSLAVAEEMKEAERDCIPGPVSKGKWKNEERILTFRRNKFQNKTFNAGFENLDASF